MHDDSLDEDSSEKWQYSIREKFSHGMEMFWQGGKYKKKGKRRSQAKDECNNEAEEHSACNGEKDSPIKEDVSGDDEEWIHKENSEEEM